MKFKFEKKVIDVLLSTIKDNQEYLTQPENLPQLAKLGYIYEMLWYSGRYCWGHDGILGKSYECEDNPKYKIEMCDPKTDEISELIYGAWALHVSNEIVVPNWEEFKNLILNGKELSEKDKMRIKPNKTFDEWVDICMNGEYSLLYPNKKSVANMLLFVIGSSYDYKDGYIIDSDDSATYGDWENSKFNIDIQKVIDNIFSIKEVEESITAAHLHVKAYYDKQIKKELKEKNKRSKNFEKYGETEMYKKIFGKKDRYEEYYPICEYSHITLFDENTHISYIQAGIDACQDIIEHSNVEEERNVEFSKEFIEKFDKKDKIEELTKEDILNNARDAFRPIGYRFQDWNL